MNIYEHILSLPDSSCMRRLCLLSKIQSCQVQTHELFCENWQFKLLNLLVSINRCYCPHAQFFLDSLRSLLSQKTDFGSNVDLHMSRIIKSLKALFWPHLEKPLTIKTAFANKKKKRPLLLIVWCSSVNIWNFIHSVRLTELSSTFGSKWCSSSYLSRPKPSFGSTYVKYGVWPRP